VYPYTDTLQVACQAWWSSDRLAMVPVVEPADVRHRDDLAGFSRLDGPGHERILAQREMRPSVMPVVDVIPQDSLQVPLVAHTHVVETLSAHRSDQSFDRGILPRTLYCNIRAIEQMERTACPDPERRDSDDSRGRPRSPPASDSEHVAPRVSVPFSRPARFTLIELRIQRLIQSKSGCQPRAKRRPVL